MIQKGLDSKEQAVRLSEKPGRTFFIYISTESINVQILASGVLYVLCYKAIFNSYKVKFAVKSGQIF